MRTLFCLALLFTTKALSAQTGMIFYEDCEKSPVFAGEVYPATQWTSQQAPSECNNSITVSNRYSRKGSNSYRFETNKCTNLSGYLAYKAELVWNFRPPGTPAYEDYPGNGRPVHPWRWTALSMFLPNGGPEDWAIDTRPGSTEGIGFNFKIIEEGWVGSGMGIREINGKNHFIWTLAKRTADNNATKEEIDLGPIVKGEWIDWVVERNWTWTDTGYVRVWRNGTKVVEYLGPNWPHPTQSVKKYSKEAYLQLGLYTWGFDDKGFAGPAPFSKRVMYMDEIRFGYHQASYQDFVVQGGGQNLPLVSAGQDLELYLPDSTIQLTGTITNRQPVEPQFTVSWTKAGGPAGGIIANPTSLSTTVSSLPAGTHVFNMTVTDGKGFVGTDQVTVVVFPANGPSVKFDRFGDGAGSERPNVWKAGLINNSTAVASGQTIKGDGGVQMTMRKASDGAFLSLDTDSTLENVYSPNIIWISVTGGKVYVGDYETSNIFLQLGEKVDSSDLLRIYRTGSTFRAQKFAKAEKSWYDLYTYKFKTNQVLWVKATFDNSNSRLYFPLIDTISVVNNNTVNAGPDITTALPVTRISLGGAAPLSQGAVTYQTVWRQVGGPAALQFQDSTVANTVVSQLQAGTYTLRLISTSNLGHVSSDDMFLAVNPVRSNAVVFDALAGGVTQVAQNVWQGGSLSNSTATSLGQAITGDGGVQFTVNTLYETGMLAINNDNVLENVYTPHTIWVSVLNGFIYVGDYTTTNTFKTTTVKVNSGDFVRIHRTGSLFKAQRSVDNGITWTDVHTYAYQTNAKLWVKATFNSSTSRIYYPVIHIVSTSTITSTNAGPDQVIQLPITRTTLNGVGPDQYDGTIVTKFWSMANGPARVKFSDSTEYQTTITDLQPGTYVFRITARTASGFLQRDDVVITVRQVQSGAVSFNALDPGVSQTPVGIWNAANGFNSSASSMLQSISGDGYVQMTVGASSDGGLLALDRDSTLENVYSPNLIWVSVAAGRIYVSDYINGNVFVATNTMVNSGDFVRILRTGSQFKAQRSTDNGMTWTDAYTYKYTSNAKLYMKATFDNAKSKIYFPVYAESGVVSTSQLPGTATDAGEAEFGRSRVADLTRTRVLPNPASGWIDLYAGKDINDGRAMISLFTQSGKLAARKEALMKQGAAFRMDISRLPDGIYFLIISDGSGHQINRRLIIKN